jgi:hypothetical protein
MVVGKEEAQVEILEEEGSYNFLFLYLSNTIQMAWI